MSDSYSRIPWSFSNVCRDFKDRFELLREVDLEHDEKELSRPQLNPG